jgi:uncharacterized Tic20 family protein
MDEQQPVIVPSPQRNEKMWAAFCHGSALLTFLPFWSMMAVPFGNILGPLIIWLVKKQGMPLVDKNGKEALNFQISMSLYWIIGLALISIGIGVLLLWAIAIADFFLTVIATVKTANNEEYRYPLAIRFIRR